MLVCCQQLLLKSYAYLCYIISEEEFYTVSFPYSTLYIFGNFSDRGIIHSTNEFLQGFTLIIWNIKWVLKNVCFGQFSLFYEVGLVLRL